jgi:hypothetical protein
MAVKFADLDKVNMAFSKVKSKKSLTEEAVRDAITDTTIAILEQTHKTGKKGQEKTTKITKVLTKFGSSWMLRLYYGVAVVAGAEIDASNENQAVIEAIEYCKDIKRGKADSKTKHLIKKAFEDKKKSLEEAKATRAKNKASKNN